MHLLDDTLTINTPEGVEISAVLASPVSRGWALLLDLLIMVLLFLGLIWVSSRLPEGVGLGFFLASAFVVFWGYFFLFEWLNSGVTPGKKALNLRVISQDITPPTFAQCAWRNVLRYLDFMPGMFGVGMISMMISPRNQRIGDWMAGTVVVWRDPPKVTLPVLAAGEAYPPPWRLSRQEQRTLMAFADYAHDHHLERLIELSEPLAPLLPKISGAQRVNELLAWARWLNGQTASREVRQ